MLNSFQREVGELSRSAPYAKIAEQSTDTRSLIARSVDEEKGRLNDALRRMLGCAETIPVTLEILETAVALQQGPIGSPQDAMVFASIAAHLAPARPVERCFLNRNARDFADPVVAQTFERHKCKLIASFKDGLGYLRSRMKK